LDRATRDKSQGQVVHDIVCCIDGKADIIVHMLGPRADAQPSHRWVRLNTLWLSTASTITNNPATGGSVARLISRASLTGLLFALMETTAVITTAATGRPGLITSVTSIDNIKYLKMAQLLIVQ
jgi:hypothetical protein